jgi:hypothetical protein
MILTKNSAYLHIQKTAGTWVKEVLRPIAEVYGTSHELYHPHMNKQHVFTFVRNPWAWYVSNYNDTKFGSEFYKPYTKEIMFGAFPKTLTLHNYIKWLNDPDPSFKRKLYVYYMARNSVTDKDNQVTQSMIDIARTWKDVDYGWYQHVCNNFLEYATFVGKTENVRDDLISMLSRSGELTYNLKKSITDTPIINAGNIQTDYRQHYTPELAKLVEDAHQPLITRFEYKF